MGGLSRLGACAPKPEHLLGRAGQVCLGSAGFHGLFQGARALDNGEKGVDAHVVAGSRFWGHTARQGHHRFVELFGQTGHPHGGFSHGGLSVQPPSPVTTRSALRIYCSRPVSSSMI